jgi:hypothetical protein
MLEGESKKGRFFIGATSKKQLLVCAVNRTVDMECNQVDGTSYSLLISQTPIGAGDCFCYIKNNDEKDMVISSTKLHVASDETIIVKLNDTGIPSGGSVATPANRRAGCGTPADIDCEMGNDIIGLSGGDEVDALFIKGAESSKRFPWLSGIIVPKNHTLTLWAATGAIFIRATLSIHFCACE